MLPGPGVQSLVGKLRFHKEWGVAPKKVHLKKKTGPTALGFLGGSDGKEPACNAGDLDSIPGSGSSPGGGNGNPLRYSCLENPMDRGAWRATVHGVAESRTQVSN